MKMHRKELLEQYLERVLQVQMAERDLGRASLVQSANQYLDSADPQQRLSEPIVAIFSTNIGSRTSLDFAAARNVFSIMEKYVINLLDCPWKREFRKITMYSGFYKTRIEPSLKDAWKLLVMIGYIKVGLCFELKFLPEASRLQDIAFEFYLASLECSIYRDVFKRVSSLGFALKDIHKCRRSISGDSDVLTKALLKLKKRIEGERSDSRAPSQTRDDSSKSPKWQKFEKHSDYEADIGSEFRVGGAQSENSQQQMGGLSKVVPLAGQTKEATDCEPRSESIEAMLQDITPEMISDAKIRRQILTKLTIGPQSAKSQDEHIHASLPLHQVQREGDRRPYTEPLLIPKQPLPDVASASNIQPYSEPLAFPKRPKSGVTSAMDKNLKPIISKHELTDSKVLPNVQPYVEQPAVPKQRFAADSDKRPWTEPLLVPRKEKVPTKQNSKSTEAKWQCAYCYFSNDAAVSVEKCKMCERSHKEV